MTDINLGRVQGLTTSITMNGEIKEQVDGNIDIGQIASGKDIGNLQELTTGTNESLVAAINEINGKVDYDPGIAPGPVTNANATASTKMVELTWTDPEISDPDNWAGTRIVYKTGSYPVDLVDGVNLTSSVRDQYKSKPLLLSGLVDGVEIFISIFTFNSKGTYDAANVVNVSATPTGPKDMVAIIDLSNSDPKTNITYSADALEMEPGSDLWDNFFGIKPCLINKDTGEFMGYLKEDNFREYTDGTAAPTTTNIPMIEFPRRGLTIKTVDSKTYVRMANVDPSFTGLEYDTHTNSDGDIVENIYVAVYGSIFDNTNTTRRSLEDVRALCGTYSDGFVPMHIDHFKYIQAMMILKYRSFDINAITGGGYTSTASFSGGLLFDRGMTARDSGSSRFKIFGIEDLYSATFGQFIDGIRFISNTVDRIWYRKLSETDYVDTGLSTGFTAAGIYSFIKKIQGTQALAFLPSEVNGSSSTYTKASISTISTGIATAIGIRRSVSLFDTSPFTIVQCSGTQQSINGDNSTCRIVYSPPAPIPQP